MANKTHRYRNPWHKARENASEAIWETSARPTEYRGYLIFQRVPGSWDVVKEGCCIRQMASFQGAKNAADAHAEGTTYPEGHEFPAIIPLDG